MSDQEIKALLIHIPTDITSKIRGAFLDKTFHGQNLKLDVAENLEDAIHLVSWEKYKVIAIDVSEFDQDIIKTLTLLNKESKKTPLIMISDEKDSELFEKSYFVGIHDLIEKQNLTDSILSRSLLNTLERGLLSQNSPQNTSERELQSSQRKSINTIKVAFKLLLDETAGPLTDDQRISLAMMQKHMGTFIDLD